MAAVADRKETALKLARRKGLLRTGEAAAAGVDRSTLARLCERGLLERLERGLYGLGTQEPRRAWIRLPRGVHTPVLPFSSHEVIHIQPARHRMQVETLHSGPIRLKGLWG